MFLNALIVIDLDHLESFCFDKLKRSKGSNLRPSRTTKALRPKKTWVPKVKP